MQSIVSEKNGLMQVEIEGLAKTLENLRIANARGAQIVERAIQDSGDAVLATAQAKASAFAASGAFRASLATKKTRGGMYLRSNDPAAGVIEFAHHGARTRSSKGTKLANARLAKKSGVGVPRRATQPRAMVPAVNENVLWVQNAVATALERALCGYR